ncbi:MAG TPA: acyl-CoA dehydrogenase family protein [Stenomitos sp.]
MDTDKRSVFLEQVQAYLKHQVAPHAAQLDADPQALRQALHGLGAQSWLALRVPVQLHGLGVDALTFRMFQETVSRYSGALAFLQTQHQSAAAMLATSTNTVLQHHYLPHLGTGQTCIGVGFSQLRRQGLPAVSATPLKDGYCLNGQVPWITGWTCFQHFIVGAVLPDGQVLLGMMPFTPQVQPQGGAIRFGAPLPLAVMQSTHTVTAEIDQWHLPPEAVVQIQPPDWLAQADRRNVLHHSFFALGCAQAGLDAIAAGSTFAIPVVAACHATLQQQLQTLRQRIYQAEAAETVDSASSLDYEDRLVLRAQAIQMAVQCSHAAVATARGGAIALSHPAQRIYREALAYTVFGQTSDVMAATLQQITAALPPLANPLNPRSTLEYNHSP